MFRGILSKQRLACALNRYFDENGLTNQISTSYLAETSLSWFHCANQEISCLESNDMTTIAFEKQLAFLKLYESMIKILGFSLESYLDMFSHIVLTILSRVQEWRKEWMQMYERNSIVDSNDNDNDNDDDDDDDDDDGACVREGQGRSDLPAHISFRRWTLDD